MFFFLCFNGTIYVFCYFYVINDDDDDNDEDFYYYYYRSVVSEWVRRV